MLLRISLLLLGRRQRLVEFVEIFLERRRKKQHTYGARDELRNWVCIPDGIYVVRDGGEYVRGGQYYKKLP